MLYLNKNWAIFILKKYLEKLFYLSFKMERWQLLSKWKIIINN